MDFDMSGEEFFTCQRYQARMLKIRCKERQGMASDPVYRWEIGIECGVDMSGCQDCGQGKSILAGLQKMGAGEQGTTDNTNQERSEVMERRNEEIGSRIEERKRVMKTCNKCGIEKIRDEGFHKNKIIKDGYENICKACRAVKAKARWQAKKEEGQKGAEVTVRKKRTGKRIERVGVRKEEIAPDGRISSIQAATSQPAPGRHAGEWVVHQVVCDLLARSNVGILKYGTPLQPHNGRDAVLDAYQEALDLCMYLRQAIAERETGSEEIGARK